MALDKNDVLELQEILDERYVMQKTCNDKQERVNNRFANDDKRIALIDHDFKVIKWLVSTVAASSIGALVVGILELVF